MSYFTDLLQLMGNQQKEAKKMKCALVVGHSYKSQGAENKSTKLTEFLFNAKLAEDIKNRLKAVSIEIVIVFRDKLRDLPGKINAHKPNFIISLHCNAYDMAASGTEVLYYHKSKTGHMIARVLHENLVDALELNNRGIKPKSSEDRGGYLLRYTHAPCVIAEPFFIDNNHDLDQAKIHYEWLVKAYADSILQVQDNLNGHN